MNAAKNDGRGRPDNALNRKFEIVCSGISALCRLHQVQESSVHVFMDYFSIPQELMSQNSSDFSDYVMSLTDGKSQISEIADRRNRKCLSPENFENLGSPLVV